MIECNNKSNITERNLILCLFQSSLSILLDTPKKLISKFSFKHQPEENTKVDQSSSAVASDRQNYDRAAAFGSVSFTETDGCDSLNEVEVIHVHGAGTRTKKRSGRTRKSSSASSMTAVTPDTPESGYRSVLEDSMLQQLPTIKADEDGGVDLAQPPVPPVLSQSVGGVSVKDTSTDGDGRVFVDNFPEPSSSMTHNLPSDGTRVLLRADSPPSESDIGASAAVTKSPPREIASSAVRNISEDELLLSILDENLAETSRAGVGSPAIHQFGATVTSASSTASSFKEPNIFGLSTDPGDSREHSDEMLSADVSERESSLCASPNERIESPREIATDETRSDVDHDELSIYDDAGGNQRSSINADELTSKVGVVEQFNDARVPLSESEYRRTDSNELSSSLLSGRLSASVFCNGSDDTAGQRRVSMTSNDSISTVDMTSAHPMEVR